MKHKTSTHYHLLSTKRRIYVLAATLPLLVILSLAIYFGLNHAPSASAVWMDDSWAYRLKVPVTDHTGAETNKYFSVTISSSDTTKFQTDCGDIRFTDANGKLLQYYIASGCSSASTVIHVLVPSFAAGATDYYMYYGNPTATNGFSSSDFTAGTSVTVGTVGSEEKGQGPIAYWGFDEGTGTTTHDASSNNKTATFGASTAAPTWATDDQCVSGKCINFDGTNDYLDIGSATVYQNTSKTISFWANPSVDPSTTTPILSSGGGNWYVGFAGSGQMITSYKITGDAQQVSYSTTSTVVKNTWAFYEYTFSVSGSNVDVSFYVNGKLNVTRSYATGYGASYSDSWIMGAFVSSSNFYNGKLDEVKIYNYARTAAQVKADYVAKGGFKTASSTQGGATQSILSNGLVGYWSVDESATPAVDKSGSGLNGTWSGNTTAVAGKFGSAVSLDGDGDYLDMTDASTYDAIGSGSHSLFAWIKADTISLACLIMKGPYRPGLKLSPDSKITFANDTDNQALASATSITTNQWYHVGYTLNGTTAQIYINGVLDATATVTPGSFNNSSSLRVGGCNSTTTDFDGAIDEPRVYNRALSPAEVRQLYNFAPGPVGYWKMDEKTGTTASDTSGNSLSGTLQTGATWTTGKYGSGVLTDGSTGIVRVSNNSLLNFDYNQDFTVATWIKYSGTQPGANGRIIEKNGTGFPYRIHIVQSTNLIQVSRYDGSNSPAINSATAYNDGLWHYVSFSKNGSTLSLFIDGKLNGTTTDTTTTTTTNAGNLDIGGTFSSLAFSGGVDDVKIYNYARTAAQVVEDMNGSHPIGGSPVGSQVAYWDMDETNGTSAHDSTPNSNDLTLSTASWTTSGKTNSAWHGVGTNWLSRADDDDFDLSATDDGSISLWYKTTSASNPGATEYLFAKGRGSPPGYALYFNTSGFLCLSVDDDVTWTPDDTGCTTTDVYDGTWHHIVAEKTGTSEIRVYLDGKSVASDITILATGTLANSGILYVGDDDGDSTNSFNGDIDEVKFYRSALTVDQVALDMNSGSSTNYGSTATTEATQITGTAETAPVGYWPLDEKLGTSAADNSGTGNTGTLTTSPFWIAGKIGAAVDMSPTSSFISVTDNSSLNMTGDMTLELWAKPVTIDGTSRYVAMKGATTSNSTRQYDIRLNTSNQWQVGVYVSTTAFTAIDTTTVPSSTRWDHIALVRSGTNLYIYVNGSLKATTTSVSGSLNSTANVFAIGRAGASGGSYFGGQVDDVKIYNVARSQAQIAYDYNRGAPIGWWQFDECQGTVANDASGNGNTGTITIGATSTYTAVGTCTSGTSTDAWYAGASGRFNSSLAFDGADDYMNANIGFSGANGSVSLWVRNPVSALGAYILRSDANVRTYFTTDTNHIITFTKGSPPTVIGSTPAIPANTWAHVVLTWWTDSGGNLFGRAYYNGSPLGTADVAFTDSTVGTYVTVGGFNTIGTQNASVQADDARIYNYALSASQVKKLYNGGFGVNFGPSSGQP